MNITIATVGKVKDKYMKMGIEEFSKRLKPYAKINIVEVADEKAPETLSEADMEIVKKKKRNAFSQKLGKMIMSSC